MDERAIFKTPWFHLIEKTPPGWQAPHYSLRTRDYVCVVARTSDNALLLVRQYRPAVETVTLELPSGHVEPEQQPEEAARQELREETGHEATHLEWLGTLWPDVGRLGNRMWCYFTRDAVPRDSHVPETGIDTVRYTGSLDKLLREPDFAHGLNYAALLLAIAKGRIGLTLATTEE